MTTLDPNVEQRVSRVCSLHQHEGRVGWVGQQVGKVGGGVEIRRWVDLWGVSVMKESSEKDSEDVNEAGADG